MIREEEQRNGKLWQQASMRSAVAAALGLNIFNRQADKLYMCNIAQLMNVLQSVLLTDGPEGKNCVRTTNYWAFMLFKPHRGKTAVRVETDGPKLADLGWRGGRGAQPDPPPDLSLSATRKVSEMVVTLVNAAAR
jgi:alpha-N-arabinofuranosidase